MIKASEHYVNLTARQASFVNEYFETTEFLWRLFFSKKISMRERDENLDFMRQRLYKLEKKRIK